MQRETKKQKVETNTDGLDTEIMLGFKMKVINVFKTIRKILQMKTRIDEKMPNVINELKSLKIFFEKENLIVSCSHAMPMEQMVARQWCQKLIRSNFPELEKETHIM